MNRQTKDWGTDSVDFLRRDGGKKKTKNKGARGKGRHTSHGEICKNEGRA